MNRYPALLLAACVAVVFAVPAQAAVPSAVTSSAAAVATTSVSPSPTPGAHPFKPGTASSKLPGPKVPVPQSTWSWQNPKPSANPLYAVSCPTATVCYAAGFGWPIEKTINAGVSWTAQTAATLIYGISCATVTSCVAVGAYGLAVHTADGVSWSAVIINGGNFLSGVSCPTASQCYAVGFAGSIVHTANGGTTWDAKSSNQTDDLFGISCPSSSDCVAVGALGTTDRTIDGSRWTPVGSGGIEALDAISCPSISRCVSVGDQGTILSTDFAGGGWGGSALVAPYVTMASVSCASLTACYATSVGGDVYMLTCPPSGYGCWLPASTSETGALYGISCATDTSCVAVGDYGMVVSTANGGTGWQKQSPSGFPPLDSISCPSTSVCFAVGTSSDVLATTDAWTSWSRQPTPFSTNLETTALTGISCPSTTTCFAVGGLTIITTSDGGAHWSAEANGGPGGFAISCPTTIACFVVGGTTILATTDGGANWIAQATGATHPLTSISCPSSSVCYVGGYLETLGTTDAGAHWNIQPTLTDYLSGVSCPSTTVCFAAGAAIHVTTDGGTTWTDTSAPSNNYAYSAISCASTTACTAVKGQSVVSTSDGSAWATQTTLAGGPLLGVSCPSSTICMADGNPDQAGGEVVGTADASATPWHRLAPSGTNNDIYALACSTTTTCFAGAGTMLFRTTDGGAGWWPVRTLSDVGISSISCPTSSVCFAAGGACCGAPSIMATTDGGDHWTDEVLAGFGSNGFSSISCPTATTCFATGTSGFVKTVDGTNWSAPQAVTGASLLTAISCPSTSICFAVDRATPAHIFTTADGGATWAVSFDIATDPYAGNSGPFHAIACPSITTCYATGANGLIATTTDGGANWRTENTNSQSDLTGVSCPNASTCYVSTGDSTVLYSTNFGGNWDLQDSHISSQGLKAISCASTAMCFAAGLGGAITSTTTAGKAWSGLQPAESTASIRAMSCYGPNNCYAAAFGTVFATQDAGAHWVSTKLTNADSIDAISCPSATTCFATGWPGVILETTSAGADWTELPNNFSGSDETFTGISCTSVTACVIVGIGGKILSTINGSTWSAETSGTTVDLWGVSCPSASSCVAVGSHGLTLTRTGSSWHAYASGTTANFAGVSCPTVNTCYAVGLSGTIRVTTNRGATWVARASGTTENLFGIACLQPSFCVADGDFGTVQATVDGATGKPIITPTLNSFRAVAYPDLNHAWLAGFGGTILANPSLIPSCTSVSITPDQASPGAVGTTVTLSAAAAGCPDPNPLYRFYLRSPSGVWSIVKDFSTASTFAWHTSTSVPGTYLIGVWVKDAKSGFTYDAYAFGTFTLQHLPCTSVNVASDAASPQAAGITVNFTASSLGCPSPQYQWWVRNAASVWSIVVPFASSTDTFAWNTTGLVDGTYQIGVWARQAGSTKSYEAFVFVTFTVTPTITGTTHCGAVDVAASPDSPQVKTTSVTLTASVFGCDTPQYKWWVRDTAAVWHVVQNYPGTSTFVWTGTRPAGTYLLGVWVRQSGSTAAYEAYSFITYTLVVAPTNACTSVNIAPDVTSPQAPGTVVTFTAAALGCPSATYKFFVAPPNGTFGEVQAFGASNTFIWNTAGLSPGPWQIGVWARQSGSTSAYQAFAFITYQLTFG